MSFIRPFSALSKDDAEIAGGKGASLGEMSRAGIPVPEGYVVLASTFDSFLKEADLLQEIEGILAGVNHEAVHTVEQASESIQELILQAEMPEDIRYEIQEEFTKLGAEYVAVRSSATAEDGAEHAWAGQLDSYLNTTEKELLKNVQRCWASLFTPRAIFYRFEKGLHGTSISVAVVVQKMVNSEVSGIAFSVHPVTEDHNQLIIEAGFGLGEAIVSGSVTPDSYVVTKEPREIIDVNVSEQKRALSRAKGENGGGGNEWRDLEDSVANSQVLSKEQVLELSEIILRIEKRYGFPCDIEWAYESGKFYIVQSRPITTLKSKTETNSKENHALVKEITNLSWFKSWEAKFPVFLPSIGAPGYFKPLEEAFGYSLKHFLVTTSEGITAGFWVEEELKDFGATLTTLAEKSPAVLVEWSERLKKETDLCRKLLKNNTDYFFNSNHFRELRHLDEVLSAYQIAVREVINYLPDEMREEYTEVLEGARKYSETIFFELSDAATKLLEKVGEREKLPIHLVGCVSGDELEDYFRDRKLPEQTVLEKRYTRSGFINNPKYTALSGEEVEQIERSFLKNSSNEVFGTSAYKGKVTGIARVVKNFSAEQDFVRGEILVTGMTDPNYVPIMEKAGAIVTDAGGLLCHAAIVAREMQKPCVVGTKIATQIIKDGDLVEVDADNGIVRVLEGRRENTIPLKKENTIFTFESSGTAFIFEDIVSRDYIQWECVRVAKGDNVRVFVKKEEVERMHAEGARMKKVFLEGKVKSMQEKSDYIEEKIEELKRKRAFTLEEVKIFFQPLEEICRDYSFFDIHYSDGMVQGEEFTEAGEYVARVKNILRDVLGRPFFAEDGWLNTGLAILSGQFAIPVDVLKWYTKQDILNLYEEIFVSVEELENRKLSNTLYREHGHTLLVTGKKSLEYYEAFEEKNKGLTDVKGVIAHRGSGSVQGRVKVAKKDFSNPSLLAQMADIVDEGFILVTDTTDPDFLPLMKRAGAVVTDIGGLLSHASITSRELNKLCVISTVSASRVLKDGDLVEVDADNGMVRILEHGVSSIDEVWELYLTRPFNLFQTSLWHDWYNSKYAEKVLGGRFHRALYREIGLNEAQHYRPSGQIQKWKDYLEASYRQNPTEFKKNLEKGLEFNRQFVTGALIFKSLNEAVDFSQAMAMYATVLPLLGGESILNKEHEESGLYKDVVELRSTSHYAEMYQKQILPLAVQELSARGIEASLLPHCTYEELQTITTIELVKRKEKQNQGQSFTYACDKEKNEVRYEFPKEVTFKKDEKLTYVSTLERDTTLIMQGLFVEIMEKDLKEQFSINPFRGPAYFYLTNNRNVQFYENPDFVLELVKQISEKAKDVAFLEKLEKLYGESTPGVLVFWKRKKASSTEELLAYLASARNFVSSVAIAYYGGMVTDLSKEAEELFLRIRSEYDFFATADEYIRNTLENFGIERHSANLVALSEIPVLPTNEALTKRQKFGAVFAKGILTELKPDQHIADVYTDYIFLDPEIPTGQKEIRGQTAQRGIATGRVKIVKNRKDAVDIIEGDIMVSPMTTPDFLPAMKIAGAFVTDEGGITCHAAIVSRELKKPCIIGTKIATKILKDGDMVEVDSDNGVVRILEVK